MVQRHLQLTELSLRSRHVVDLLLGVHAAPAYLARAGTPATPQALDDGNA